MIRHDFSGRRALVTGAASGIGYEVCLSLLGNGAKVVAADIAELDHLRVAAGGPAELETAAFDVADAQSVSTVMAEILQGGPIDILVHCAAIVGKEQSIFDTSAEDWERIVRVNLNGTFHVNRAAARAMVDRGYGRIVNFASIAGVEGTMGIAAYGASKAAIAAFTLSLAKETAMHDVAINCIVPAAVDTPMNRVGRSEDFLPKITARISRGRMATTEEIVATVLWLCAEENSFTTGQAYNFAGARR